jgi:hypothetical protein
VRLLKRAPISLRGHVPTLSERQILRAVRIPHAQRIEDIPERGVREAVTKAARRACLLAAFAATFRSLPVEGHTHDTVLVQGSSTLLHAPSLVRLLERARQISLLTVTLGEAWDEALDELAARDEPAEAWFLDAIGTAMADRAARAVEDRIESDMAREGLTRIGRYRPGYGDWKLEAQAELCALTDAEQIGVRINEAYALLPRKSITGVVGWRENSGEGEPMAAPSSAVKSDEDEGDSR